MYNISSFILSIFTLCCTNQTFISINFFLFSCAFFYFFSAISLKHFRVLTVDGAKIGEQNWSVS